MKLLNTTGIVLIFLFSCSPSKQGTVKYGKDGKIESGTSSLKCTYPLKTYVRELDVKVKASIDSLISLPSGAELDLGIQQKVTRLSDYSTQGLDFDLIMFRICEMANNRGFTNEQTQALITKAMEIWNAKKDSKGGATNNGVNNGIIAGRDNYSAGRDQVFIYGDNIRITGKPRMDTESGQLGKYEGRYRIDLFSRNNGGRKIDNLTFHFFVLSRTPNLLPAELFPVDPDITVLPGREIKHTHTFPLSDIDENVLLRSYNIMKIKFRDAEDNEYDSSFSFGKTMILNKKIYYLRLSAAERDSLADLMAQLKIPGNQPFPWKR